MVSFVFVISEYIHSLYLFFENDYWARDATNHGIDCRVASYTEWKILYVLCKDKDGLLHKDTIRAVYDGSLFEKMEKERTSAHKKA